MVSFDTLQILTSCQIAWKLLYELLHCVEFARCDASKVVVRF